jgi:hypothetical protein
MDAILYSVALARDPRQQEWQQLTFGGELGIARNSALNWSPD